MPPLRAALSTGHAGWTAPHAIAGGGGGASLDKGPQYDDVRDAWRYYLEHDNRGRGVVLVGHSQGSFILTELIRQEIDGKPVQSRLVSAILLGATFAVPRGKDVGGSFQHIPLCRKPRADRMRRDLRVVPLDRRLRRRTPGSARSPSQAWSRRARTPPRSAAAAATLHAYLARDGPDHRRCDARPGRGSCPSGRSTRPGSACLAC